MQITPTTNSITHKTPQVKQPSFTGLMRLDPKTYAPLDSWFFRDYTTLKSAADEIKYSFPQGAEVLDYACSNGEETISLKALLPDEKYKIIGYDTSESALKLAKRGVYTVFSHWHDSFLLPEAFPNRVEQQLKNGFYRIMEETLPEPQDVLINNKKSYFNLKKGLPGFIESFFRITPDKKEEIDIRRGSIGNLAKYRSQTSKPLGAVFFRNALYQICGNDLNETLEQRKISQFSYDKKAIIANFVDDLYHKIDRGGIFVIGDHIKDHLFLADKNTPEKEKLFFKDCPFFNPKDSRHIKAAYVEVFKESPLKTELEKANRFTPIGYSTTHLVAGGKKLTVPTIWKILK